MANSTRRSRFFIDSPACGSGKCNSVGEGAWIIVTNHRSGGPISMGPVGDPSDSIRTTGLGTYDARMRASLLQVRKPDHPTGFEE